MHGLNESGAARTGRSEAGYSIAEVVIAVLVLGMLALTLLAAFSSGLALVQMARENLRATQIMTQKVEAMRLMTWLEGGNTNYVPPIFTEWYDPTGTNTQSAGVLYCGTVSIANAPSDLPSGYSKDVRLVTVTLTWTNTMHGSSNVIVRSRQMQTYVARYGMQNYVYR